ncbi:MAG: DUF1244 domain-containing protein [Alphaproteobacteria bacterium]|nr:DUF1244 domain-containing protein [Alphaproteobacteria bacterium]
MNFGTDSQDSQAVATTAEIPESVQQAIEAAAFRSLVAHLQSRSDVQNLELMNLAGFCRNCLSRWYREAAAQQGYELPDGAARERVYGMTMAEWKANYQK